MFRCLARVVAALVLLTAPVLIAPMAQAAQTSVDDCVSYAVGNGANQHLAAFACHEDSLTGCYRIFRDNYGRQQWALEACRLRTAETRPA
jgi:hypothetical protein